MKHLRMIPLSLITSLLLASACNNEPEPANSGGEAAEGEVLTAKGAYILAVKSNASSGEEYIIQTTSLTTADLNINQNQLELELTDYSWIFNGNTAVGFVYGYAQPGTGYALRLNSEEKAVQALNNFRIEPRYTSYGFFDNQLVTMVGGLVSADGTRNDLAVFSCFSLSSSSVTRRAQYTVYTEDVTGNGQQITFSGIADNGDGTFMTAAIQSDFHQAAANDGSSIGRLKYPDSVWVARMDREMNVLKLYGDNRLSFCAGRWRSQMLNELFKTDSPDTTYVFSSGIDSLTTRPAGAIRLVAARDDFDDYYWNLEEAAGGYKFRRVWHVTDDIYLLQFYDTKTPGNTSVAHQYALADMSEKRFTWLSGIPAKNQIRSGENTAGSPLFDGGVLYLPLTSYGADAALYRVNPYTGVATKGITVKGCSEIRAIGRLTVR